MEMLISDTDGALGVWVLVLPVKRFRGEAGGEVLLEVVGVLHSLCHGSGLRRVVGCRMCLGGGGRIFEAKCLKNLGKLGTQPTMTPMVISTPLGRDVVNRGGRAVKGV